jgi:hypothetical protein
LSVQGPVALMARKTVAAFMVRLLAHWLAS